MSATTPMLLLLGLLTLVVPLMGVTMALTPYLMPKRECFAVTVPDDAAAETHLSCDHAGAYGGGDGCVRGGPGARP